MAKPNIRALATDPLAPFRHEPVTVPEWEGATLVVRQLTAGDWIDYRAEIARAREVAGLEPGDKAEGVPVNVVPATALVLVRTLFDPAGKRVLRDEDAAAVAASFSDVHGRLVDQAFALSGVVAEPDPVAAAGNG